MSICQYPAIQSLSNIAKSDGLYGYDQLFGNRRTNSRRQVNSERGKHIAMSKGMVQTSWVQELDYPVTSASCGICE